MSTPELKPCPLCCGDVTFKQSHVADEGGWIEHVKPGWCAVQFSCLSSDENEALIKEWNTRHNPAESALNAAREAIETELKFAEFEQRQRLRAALAQIDTQQSKTT